MLLKLFRYKFCLIPVPNLWGGFISSSREAGSQGIHCLTFLKLWTGFHSCCSDFIFLVAVGKIPISPYCQQMFILFIFRNYMCIWSCNSITLISIFLVMILIVFHVWILIYILWKMIFKVVYFLLGLYKDSWGVRAHCKGIELNIYQYMICKYFHTSIFFLTFLVVSVKTWWQTFNLMYIVACDVVVVIFNKPLNEIYFQQDTMKSSAGPFFRWIW